jgi:hypothetical protein
MRLSAPPILAFNKWVRYLSSYVTTSSHMWVPTWSSLNILLISCEYLLITKQYYTYFHKCVLNHHICHIWLISCEYWYCLPITCARFVHICTGRFYVLTAHIIKLILSLRLNFSLHPLLNMEECTLTKRLIWKKKKTVLIKRPYRVPVPTRNTFLKIFRTQENKRTFFAAKK